MIHELTDNAGLDRASAVSAISKRRWALVIGLCIKPRALRLPLSDRLSERGALIPSEGYAAAKTGTRGQLLWLSVVCRAYRQHAFFW